MIWKIQKQKKYSAPQSLVKISLDSSFLNRTIKTENNKIYASRRHARNIMYLYTFNSSISNSSSLRRNRNFCQHLYFWTYFKDSRGTNKHSPEAWRTSLFGRNIRNRKLCLKALNLTRGSNVYLFVNSKCCQNDLGGKEEKKITSSMHISPYC